MTKKYIVTQEKLQGHTTRKLAQSFLPSTQWKGIIAVSRGGLVPATI